MKKILTALFMTLMIFSGACADEDAFFRADSDGNGRIDRQEFEQAVEKRFRSYDVSKDGFLDMSEIRDVQQINKGVDVIGEFDAMDTNRDGMVDLKEFKDAASKRFQERDRNADGYLDRPEVDYRTHYQDPGSVMKPFGGFYF